MIAYSLCGTANDGSGSNPARVEVEVDAKARGRDPAAAAEEDQESARVAQGSKKSPNVALQSIHAFAVLC